MNLYPGSSDHAGASDEDLGLPWPMHDRQQRFGLGRLLDCTAPALGKPASERDGGPGAIGRWECELAGNRLTWSDEVYDIFGLPRGDRVSRDEAVAHYCEHSRAVMEGLRSYAIRHNQGFIVDAEIRPRHGNRRWMRLIAVPDCVNGVVVRLRGVKQII
jgi:PAS domain-containing protein